MRRGLGQALAVGCAVLSMIPAAAAAATTGEVLDARQSYDGTQRLHYEYGPVTVIPGQNEIQFAPNQLKPNVPGYITRFKPDVIYADGSGRVPRVDVIHLHHGVWIINGRPIFAAGEEKTILNAPRGYGFAHKPKDEWILNTMLHNLTPTKSKVYITYDIDFVPEDAPGAAEIKEAKIRWLDVAGIKAYPVFDVKRGTGTNGKYTFPDQAKGIERSKIGDDVKWQPNRDITLLQTGGHLHPGGLWTDLFSQRDGQVKQLFRSEAHYFEPAGAVSWDVAMTVTPPDWKVAVKAGDTLNISTTYDSKRASWYESMGIMPILYTDGIEPGAKDPFSEEIVKSGKITHGPLKENANKGGLAIGLPDARKLKSGANGGTVRIKDFIYGRGDLRLTGKAGRPPTVVAGGSLSFDNKLDNLRRIYHTITGCKSPCNRSTGVAYPLADGAVFDSGELGTGPVFATPTANRVTWKTPKSLKAGTYSYFCRVHPFMRGSFRVVPKKPRRS